ncbi:MAG: site-specific DNA-methyltransferase [Prevotella sp.]|nr:site-specific DNA-methyltransferase [Prevotella sp.]
MIHLEKQTPNGAQLNLDALYQIAPSCFTEAKGEDGEVHRVVDFNKLRLLLGDQTVEDAPEVYDFTWVGKRAALQEAAAPINKTLRPCPEESVDWDNTQNLYIEGDNLEVLKLLQNSYMGKVKMIYIDPPYNTGNDFVYHDDFAQSAEEYDESNRDEEGNRYRKNTDSNGRFHSDWCSMMYSRLMVARTLLKEDGLIFISIDDNEADNMRKICNEVFGEDNFVAQFVWNTEGHTDNQFIIKNNHEYIISYCKNHNSVGIGWVIDPNTRLESNLWKGYAENSITKNGEKNPPLFITLKKGFPCKEESLTLESNSPAQGFWEEVKQIGYISRQITAKYNVTYPVRLDKMVVENRKLTNDVRVFSGWGNSDKLKAFMNSDFKPLEEVDGKCSFYLSPNGVIYYYKERTKARNIVSVLRNMGTTEQMRSQLENNNIYFSYPKPIELLKYIIKIGTDGEEDIILDFFSGSSTSASAVLENNLNNGTRHKFIMVQWPEETEHSSLAFLAGYKNICEIGKERIRRAGKKIKEESPLTNQKLDTGFRVFKCEDSNYKEVAFAPKEYTQDMLAGLLDNIKEDRTDLDLLFDCMLRWGVELSMPLSSQKVDGCTIHNVNDGDLVACFDGNVTEKVIDAIAALSPVRVVFRDSSFNEAANKMNLFELFKQKCDWTDEEVKNNVRVI